MFQLQTVADIGITTSDDGGTPPTEDEVEEDDETYHFKVAIKLARRFLDRVVGLELEKISEIEIGERVRDVKYAKK